MRVLSCITAAILMLGCQQNTPKTEPLYLTVLHTNDHHGRFWHNEEGEYGMAARKTLIDSLRLEAANAGHSVVLLSGGDINTGVPESDLQFAEPDFKGMRMLGYDAMAIGNHEFDNPLGVLDKQAKWAGFPFLSANILDKSSGQFAYKPYTILQKGELEIAVIGLTTTDTAKIANPEYVGHFNFQEPVEATRPLIKQLNEKYNPDFMIAVTHMGHYIDANHGINAPGDVTLARGLESQSLDMIIGGHSQEPVCFTKEGQQDSNFAAGKSCHPDNQNGIWIMQAHEWGKYVGKAVFKLENKVKTLESYELIPVNLKDESGQFIGGELKKNQEMLAMLTPFQKIGEQKIEGAVGESLHYLDGKRDTVRFKQSPLGDVIIRAQMEAVNADFGIISGGGIRASIKKGDVSYKDILMVHPFKNRISYIDFNVDELTAYLNVVSQFPVDSGAYLQFEGIEFEIINGQIQEIKINGAVLDSSRTYRMSVNSYNAAGGDGYPIINTHPAFRLTDSTDAEVLKAYFEKHSPITL